MDTICDIVIFLIKGMCAKLSVSLELKCEGFSNELSGRKDKGRSDQPQTQEEHHSLLLLRISDGQ